MQEIILQKWVTIKVILQQYSSCLLYFCQVQKKKIWESVQPHLKTTDNCIAVLGEHPMRTSAGKVFCKSLQGAGVS
jgi:hypothetical protein